MHTGREGLNNSKQWFAENTNPEGLTGSISEVMPGADVFIGLSGPDLITVEDVRSMATDPVVFAMANPDPEIRPELIADIAAVIATGRSDFPNQINNVLAFPGCSVARSMPEPQRITENMKVAAAGARSHRRCGGRAGTGLHHPVGVRPRGGRRGRRGLRQGCPRGRRLQAAAVGS